MTEGGKVRRRLRDEESYDPSSSGQDDEEEREVDREGINEEGENEESSKEEEEAIDPSELSAIDSFA